MWNQVGNDMGHCWSFFRIYVNFYKGECELIIDNSEHDVECVVKHMGQGVPDYPMSDRQTAQDSLLWHLPAQNSKSKVHLRV